MSTDETVFNKWLKEDKNRCYVYTGPEMKKYKMGGFGLQNSPPTYI